MAGKRIIKAREINWIENEVSEDEDDIHVVVKIPVVIKRRDINYSYQQKFNLGIMTQQEYYAWMLQLQEEEKNKLKLESKSEGEKHTFWEGEEERLNISDDEYNDILMMSGVDVTNAATMNFEEMQMLAASGSDLQMYMGVDDIINQL